MLEVEKIIRLYPDDTSSKGACIQITPNPDAPDFGVCVMTDHDKESIDWFGSNRLTFYPDELKVFGQACVDFANDFDERTA